jgi:hypothetical protein
MRTSKLYVKNHAGYSANQLYAGTIESKDSEEVQNTRSNAWNCSPQPDLQRSESAIATRN